MLASSPEVAAPSASVDPQEDEISPHDVDPVTGFSDAADPAQPVIYLDWRGVDLRSNPLHVLNI